MNILQSLLTIFGAALFLIFLSFLFSWPVYMLWNHCLVDAIQGVKEVTWLQAWGLNILVGFLFRPSTNAKE